jgi:hypothetical protein
MVMVNVIIQNKIVIPIDKYYITCNLFCYLNPRIIQSIRCHHLAGDLGGAEQSLSAVIERCPTHAHALYVVVVVVVVAVEELVIVLRRYNRGLVRRQMSKSEAKQVRGAHVSAAAVAAAAAAAATANYN